MNENHIYFYFRVQARVSSALLAMTAIRPRTVSLRVVRVTTARRASGARPAHPASTAPSPASAPSPVGRARSPSDRLRPAPSVQRVASAPPPGWWTASRRKEGNVLFYNALNIFYLWLYGVGCMVKYHRYSQRGIFLHGLLFFRLAARDPLYVPFKKQDSTYHAFVMPVVEHWLEWEMAQWVHHDPTTFELQDMNLWSSISHCLQLVVF